MQYHALIMLKSEGVRYQLKAATALPTGEKPSVSTSQEAKWVTHSRSERGDEQKRVLSVPGIELKCPALSPVTARAEPS